MMKRRLSFVVFVAFWFIISNTAAANDGPVTNEDDLEYIDLVLGTGAVAGPESVVVVHITGWLDDNGQKGAKIISSRDLDHPVSFKVGTEKVMKAWSKGVRGMRVGGKRRLMVPSNLGYGAKSVGDLVPPNAELIFDIELLDVR